MTAAVELIERARSLGVSLIPAGDKLRWRAPQPLPAELLDELRQHKPELLAVLQQPVPVDMHGLPYQPCPCGCPSFWRPRGGDWRCQDCAPYTGILQPGAMTCTLPPRGWPVLATHCRLEQGTSEN